MDFDKAVAELDALVATLERDGDERALMALELVDAIHRPALERIAAGELDHPQARAVLAMYDLAPVDDRTLVEEALDEVRPYVESHGGSVELISVSDGAVRVRMSGSCVGCAASAMTLRRGIEGALRERYPGFREVIAEEGEPAASPLLPIENLRAPVFEPAGSVDLVAAGELRAVEVDGTSVLLANVGSEVYGFRNRCPVDGNPLEGGRLDGSVLVCPWHNCAYDARTGKRVDAEDGDGLAPVPIALRDGAIEVAVNVA